MKCKSKYSIYTRTKTKKKRFEKSKKKKKQREKIKKYENFVCFLKKQIYDDTKISYFDYWNDYFKNE